MSAQDWNQRLFEPLEVQVNSDTDFHQVASPTVFSLPIKPKRLKVNSFLFDVVEDPAEKSPRSIRPNRAKADAKAKSAGGGKTRIQPPKDVIKLADRLFYLLQPPLETLLQSKTVELPFDPFDFQYAGVAFLFPRHNAVLADEMGLGKTMQAITTLRLLLRSGFIKNVLLVCPKPLVTNWQRELGLWAPEIPVSLIDGKQAKREWQWENDKTAVKIANYELVVRDKEVVSSLEEPFDLMVVDEAQRIKNSSSTTSKTIREIKRKRSWALTGTPIENSTEDLFGIFDFVAPGAISPVMTHRELKQELGEYVLRRTKDMVIKDMPPKLVRDTELGLTQEQAANYEQAEKQGVIRLSEMGEEITVSHVFELVLRLKQICNFDPATGASSKLELLKSDLEEVAASGQKAIVFSQWVKTLDRISEELQPFNPLSYHGRIPSKKRDPILEEFKNSPDRHVLLMSYGAGAVGLNLQFCRYVYLFDRWWNPAVEDQAINRAHRIGAAGSVTVTRMIMAGTIEQRIHEVLEAKRELFNEILSDQPVPTNRGLTRDEIFGLFNLKTPSGTISPKTANAA
ncbi:MAG: DEAD/DEAH box helicase [Planctomycetota bacterium]